MADDLQVLTQMNIHLYLHLLEYLYDVDMVELMKNIHRLSLQNDHYHLIVS